ncbi:MAG: TolC family protein, partial [Acidobacteria bacterium]|nr:TolC family protein [Acidobacteriota bacterium]
MKSSVHIFALRMVMASALLCLLSFAHDAVRAQTPQSGGAGVTTIPTSDSLPSGNQTVTPAQQQGVTPQQGTTQQGTTPIAQPAPQQQGTTQTQAQQQQSPAQVQPPAGTQKPGLESVPTATPNQLPAVPAVAPDFRASTGPFPELNRVGVDMAEQRPISMREAISMALANNKDIEVARQNVRIAEYDLLGARGAYDPRFTSLSYYEKTETPATGFLSGSNSGSVTQYDVTGTFRFEGLAPKYGGGYRIDFSSIRLTTNNQFTA